MNSTKNQKTIYLLGTLKTDQYLLILHSCRQNPERTEDYCSSPQLKRQLHSQWARDPGCKQQPLFSIPLDHVIVDELHLLLRITDRLEAGIIYTVLDWDEVS